MTAGKADAVDVAVDQVLARYDQLLQLVEEGALDDVTEARCLDYLQRFDQVRNRLVFLERQLLAELGRRNLRAAG